MYHLNNILLSKKSNILVFILVVKSIIVVKLNISFTFSVVYHTSNFYCLAVTYRYEIITGRLEFNSIAKIKKNVFRCKPFAVYTNSA